MAFGPDRLRRGEKASQIRPKNSYPGSQRRQSAWKRMQDSSKQIWCQNRPLRDRLAVGPDRLRREMKARQIQQASSWPGSRRRRAAWKPKKDYCERNWSRNRLMGVRFEAVPARLRRKLQKRLSASPARCALEGGLHLELGLNYLESLRGVFFVNSVRGPVSDINKRLFRLICE